MAVLDLAYLVTFGSELAVVSMLPLFFKDTFGLSLVAAGMLASGYAFMNLVARPSGGLISDRFGRKKTLLILLAGLAGAYGNVGAVSFLTVLSFVSPQIFFTVIAAAAVVTLVMVALFLEEPEGHMAEVLPDGTVQMIEVT
jgi:NNP family nitrate/nitrite transporter-like MFS transporter